ncbi:MAG: hypothetical protein AMJ92_12690 [candidate division Zixibacteria bacterium SM23_81]|nr:MAG: hypothetical protein AMJ92_12690 [candidate division Zixibacteria bacterium SM23_81]
MAKNDLSDRLLDLSAEVIQIVGRLRKTAAGRHIGNQLIRSGTSAGANYEEACAAESRADFIHKLQIVLKEVRECNYWLRLVAKTKLLPNNDRCLIALIQESMELTNIMAKSIVTAKRS